MQLKFSTILVALLLLANQWSAQELLGLDDAIRLALEKNYAIQTASISQKIAKAQNNLGAAGMSPTVTLNGTLNNSVLNSNQVFNTGAVQDKTGAKNNALNASINADWMVFDGLRMFAVKKRLNLNEGLSELNLRQQMENTIYEVMKAYYDVVRISELLKAGEQNIKMYEERKKIAELRLSIGSDSKVEVLLSRSDLNRALSLQNNLSLQLLQAKANLNTLLARSVTAEFTVKDSLAVSYEPVLEDLKKTSNTKNSSLLISRQNELIFGQGAAEVRAASLPFLTLNGAYVFSRTQSQAGFLFSSRQNGLNYGMTLRWTIFNGGRNYQLINERNLLALNQKVITERTTLEIDALVYLQYQSFLIQKKIMGYELQNLGDSKEVQEISLERYRIGKGNLLETIETQKNLEDAQASYITAAYNSKMAEAELLRLNGSLVK